MPQYLINAVANYLFVLVLNPMKSAAEAHVEFGPFPTYEAALAAHDSCLLAEPLLEKDPDNDRVWHHFFRKDSQLAGMNCLTAAERTKPGPFQHGIHEVFAQLAQVNSKTPFQPVPGVST